MYRPLKYAERQLHIALQKINKALVGKQKQLNIALQKIEKALTCIAECTPADTKVKTRRKAGFITQTEMAKLCNVNNHALFDAIRFGTCPEPTHTIENGSRRYYTPEDKAAVQKGLAERIGRNSLFGLKAELGYRSRYDVSRTLGVSRIVVDHHIKNGNIAAPKRRIRKDGRKLQGHYYSKDEANRIIKWYQAWKRLPENRNIKGPR